MVFTARCSHNFFEINIKEGYAPIITLQAQEAMGKDQILDQMSLFKFFYIH